MDELYRPERGLAHLVAGLLFLLNPYTVIFTSRGTVSLLAYAALPWLVLAAHRGLHTPRGWRWPIAFALILSLAGGGVNAGVIAWALVAPAGLLVYEAAVLGRSWREVWSFAWRAGLLAAVASAWWAVPVLLQGPYGEEFLSFTEQPGTIWGDLEPVRVDPPARLLGDVRGGWLRRDGAVPAGGSDVPLQRGRDRRRRSWCRCSRSAGCCSRAAGATRRSWCCWRWARCW